ncbi:MAG TPA: hypothetical protein VHY09_04855 [Candidatus Methylacidiphilales bacterium]|nr:hypothetical protein [Candidatus Methylacidiphilales bacterium]
MDSCALKDGLKDWLDRDSAAFAIAVSLGILAQEANYQNTGVKYVFWSRNPLGDMLYDHLDKLVRVGIVEYRESDDDCCYRWDPLFKGAWEKGMVKISYREFSDVPRFFIIRLDCNVWLFDCRFDESIDEYPEVYKVYSLPKELLPDDDWNRIAEAGNYLGTVKVADLKFDETKRQELDLDFFSSFQRART